MSDARTEKANKRATSRAQRRASNGTDNAEPDARSEQSTGGIDAGQAARAAATAAVVGAAVGALKAIASRNGRKPPAASDEKTEASSAEETAADHEDDGATSEPEPVDASDDSADDEHDDGNDDEREEPEPEPEPERKPEHEPARQPIAADDVGQMTTRARELLRELRGVEPESVAGFSRTASGWAVTLEVVELRRVPDTTDVLATYEVELDDQGELLRYQRGRRYYRAQGDGGDGA